MLHFNLWYFIYIYIYIYIYILIGNLWYFIFVVMEFVGTLSNSFHGGILE